MSVVDLPMYWIPSLWYAEYISSVFSWPVLRKYSCCLVRLNISAQLLCWQHCFTFFFLVTDVKINQHERVFYASLNFPNTVLAVLQIKHYGSLHIIPWLLFTIIVPHSPYLFACGVCSRMSFIIRRIHTKQRLKILSLFHACAPHASIQSYHLQKKCLSS